MLNWLVARIDGMVPRPWKAAAKRVFPDVDRRIYRLVQALTPNDVRTVTIQGGPLSGRRFTCTLKYERDYWLGIHEPQVVQFLTERLSKGDVFFDVGMHKGYVSLIAALLVGDRGQVVGFEPNPTNRQAVRHNLGLNPDLAPTIRIEGMAVTDKTGTVLFAGKAGASVGRVVSFDGPTPETAYEVESISLDEYIQRGQTPPNVIKMDIEGGEQWALRGMQGLLQIHRPLLILEVHNSAAWTVLSDVVRETRYRLAGLDGSPIELNRVLERRLHCLVIPESASNDSGQP